MSPGDELRVALAEIARDRAYAAHEAARDAERRALNTNDVPGAPAAKHGPGDENTDHDAQEDAMTSDTDPTRRPAPEHPDWCDVDACTVAASEGAHVSLPSYYRPEAFDLETVILRGATDAAHVARVGLDADRLDAAGVRELIGALNRLETELADLDRGGVL